MTYSFHSVRAFALAAICSTLARPMSVAADKVTYDDHVRPLFREHCLQCHNPDKARGGLDLASYQAALAGGSSGEVVVPGDPGGSSLFLVMAHEQEPFMPENGSRRPDPDLRTVREWIEGGLLENDGSRPRTAKSSSVKLQMTASPGQRPEGPPALPENLSLEPAYPTEQAAAVTALAASPWAPLVALGGYRQVVLHRTDTQRPAGVLAFPEGQLHVVRFSRNGTLLLAGGGVGGKSGRVVLWDVRRGERILEVGDEYDVVLSADLRADQSEIALGGPGRVVKVFSTEDRQLRQRITKHTDWVTAVRYSPDGVLLATGDRAAGLWVWEADSGQEFYTLAGHKEAITAVGWRPDANVLASASEDGTVKIWNMHNGKQIKSWTAHPDGVLDLAYTRNGELITCGRDQTLKRWNGEGKNLRTWKGFSDLPTACVSVDEGNLLAVGDWRGDVRLYNREDDRRVASISPNPPTLANRIAAVGAAWSQHRTTLDQHRKEALAQATTIESLRGALEEAEAEAAQRQALERLHRETTETLERAREETRRTTESLADIDCRLVASRSEDGEADRRADQLREQLESQQKAWHAAEEARRTAERETAAAAAERAYWEAERVNADLRAYAEARASAQASRDQQREVLVEAQRAVDQAVALVLYREQQATALAHTRDALRESSSPTAPSLPEAGHATTRVIFEDNIRPILESRCIDCHGPEKQKGGIRLDRKEDYRGPVTGDSGDPLIIPGEPEKSSLVARVALPPDDIDIMPETGDPLTPIQIETLARWIRQGAFCP